MSSAILERAQSGGLAAASRLSAVWQKVVAAQQGQGFLWCAPALAIGAGAYFALPFEPVPSAAVLAAVLGLILLWRGGAGVLAMLAGMVCLGFALACLETGRHQGPLLAATTPEVAVAGEVVAIEQGPRGRHTLVLDVSAIAGLAADRTPARLRLSLPDSGAHAAMLSPGMQVDVLARLAPLPSPVMPGGFDFGRSLYLEGIGGTGRITSEVTVLALHAGVDQRIDDWLARLRAVIGARIHAVLTEPSASFAEALITGERGRIPPEINRSLMVSGLYHILSISGLHMWLVAGGVFWAVRAGLALSPRLALGYPIRKWAAAAALAMGFFYMQLADSGVATMRAFLMIAIVFFAIMVDRPALSMRNLALAGLFILLVEPHSVVSASFQMSFLAVMGLVAFYEAWSRLRRGRAPAAQHSGWGVRLGKAAVVAFDVSILTAFIAGVCSTIPAAYHFGRIAPYSVLANGLAIPVVGCVVMPAAIVAVLAMPLGLEWLPLTVMGHGLDAVVAISDGVASLPHADEVVRRPPALAMIVMGAGLVTLCLLAGPARMAGLLVTGLGLAMALAVPPGPDLLIEASGRTVAFRDDAGVLVPAHARRGRFAVEAWLQANGEEVRLAEAARRVGWTCADGLCVTEVRGRRVVFVTGREAPPDGCSGADVLVTDFPLRGACPEVPVRIDRFDLWRRGAHAVWLEGPEPRVVTARGEQGRRPWTVQPEARARPPDTPIIDDQHQTGAIGSP